MDFAQLSVIENNLLKGLLTLAGIFFLPYLPSPAQTLVSQQIRQQIRATIVSRYAAYGHHDAPRYLSLYCPDYVEILQTGKPYPYISLRRGILKAFAKPRRFHHNTVWIEYKILHCSLTSKTVTADALITLGYPIYRPGSKQIDHYFYGDGHIVDLWQHTGNRWALKHRKEIHFRTVWTKQKRSHLI